LHRLITIVITVFLAGCLTPRNSRAYYFVTVKSGDSLTRLASEFDTTPNSIAQTNKIKTGQALEIGSVLKIFPGEAYLRLHTAAGSGVRSNVDDSEDSASQLIPKLRWPLRGQISSLYGMRGRRMHTGIDIRSPKGTPIQSAHDGMVVFAGWRKGYGNTVEVQNQTQGVSTLYTHCLKLNVRVGQSVKASQVIALVGRSGNATGYHLHFEVLDANKRHVDPLLYLDSSSQRLSALP
jgi:murein DD-endopeptidase MepM/ murein hydrolase activator NlpD